MSKLQTFLLMSVLLIPFSNAQAITALSGLTGEPIEFSCQEQTGYDNYCKWTWPNGSVSTGSTKTGTFSLAGTYYVSVERCSSSSYQPPCTTYNYIVVTISQAPVTRTTGIHSVLFGHGTETDVYVDWPSSGSHKWLWGSKNVAETARQYCRYMGYSFAAGYTTEEHWREDEMKFFIGDNGKYPGIFEGDEWVVWETSDDMSHPALRLKSVDCRM